MGDGREGTRVALYAVEVDMRITAIFFTGALLAVTALAALPAEAHGRYGRPVPRVYAPRPVPVPVVPRWFPPVPRPVVVPYGYGYGYGYYGPTGYYGYRAGAYPHYGGHKRHHPRRHW